MRDWNQIRKKGEKHFIVFYGVLGWGLLTGILFQAIQHFVLGKPITIAGVSIIIITFTIGGYFFGKVMWNSKERATRNSGE